MNAELPPIYVLTTQRSQERQAQFSAAWPAMTFTWVHGPDWRDYPDSDSLADLIAQTCENRLILIRKRHWRGQLCCLLGHQRALRTAWDEHPDTPGVLIFEDDAIPTVSEGAALTTIASRIRDQPQHSWKFSGPPHSKDWANTCCCYVTQSAAQQILSARKLLPVDALFWTVARPNVCKPYPVRQRGPSITSQS